MKKLLSVLLVFVMLLALAPMTLASGELEKPAETVEEMVIEEVEEEPSEEEELPAEEATDEPAEEPAEEAGEEPATNGGAGDTITLTVHGVKQPVPGETPTWEGITWDYEVVINGTLYCEYGLQPNLGKRILENNTFWCFPEVKKEGVVVRPLGVRWCSRVGESIRDIMEMAGAEPGGTGSFQLGEYYWLGIGVYCVYTFEQGNTRHWDSIRCWLVDDSGNRIMPGNFDSDLGVIYFYFNQLTLPVETPVYVMAETPSVGKNPVFGITAPSGRGCHLSDSDAYRERDGHHNSVRWFDETEGRALSSYGNDPFKVGHVYTLSAYLEPDQYYYWPEEGMSGSISGYSAEFVKQEDDVMQITYTFPPLTEEGLPGPDDPTAADSFHIVKFLTSYGTAPAAQLIPKETWSDFFRRAKEPVAPTDPDGEYVFQCWQVFRFVDVLGVTTGVLTEYDFSTLVDRDMYLLAKWRHRLDVDEDDKVTPNDAAVFLSQDDQYSAAEVLQYCVTH